MSAENLGVQSKSYCASQIDTGSKTSVAPKMAVYVSYVVSKSILLSPSRKPRFHCPPKPSQSGSRMRLEASSYTFELP